MTQLRKDPYNISNHFDELFKGIGKSNSSFTDIDGLVNDFRTHRFLMLEFKNESELLSRSQEITLEEFSRKPGCSAWAIWRSGSNYDVRFFPGSIIERVEGAELREAFKKWWMEEHDPIQSALDYFLEVSK